MGEPGRDSAGWKLWWGSIQLLGYPLVIPDKPCGLSGMTSIKR